MLSSPLLKQWFVSLSLIVSMYWGLASMEKTVDHRNISVDELDCGEERERVRERKKEKERERDKERDKTRGKERKKGKERKAGKEIRNDDILEQKHSCIH